MRSDDDASPGQVVSVNIDLAELNSQGCLNIEKYFQRIRSLPTDTSVRRVTTDFDFLSGNGLPRKFYDRITAGNFEISDATLSDLVDIPVVAQTDCEQVLFPFDGHAQAYEVASSGPNFIVFEDQWGGRSRITWLDPNSLQIEVVSLVNDNLCNSGSQGKIRSLRKISWGLAERASPTLPGNSISPQFLEKVSSAKGYASEDLYNEAGDLLADKLKELKLKSLNNELFQCY